MNLITSIFLIISALLLGIALGGFVASLRQDRKSAGLADGSGSDDLLRLRKDPDSGAIELTVDGKSFRSVADMNNTQRTLAGYAANDLRIWLSTPVVSEGSVGVEKAAATPEPAPADEAPAYEAAVAQPASTPPEIERGEDGNKQKPEEAKKSKWAGFFGIFTRALGTDVSSVQPGQKSIAMQVNEILKEKLKDTPLEKRGIELFELPGQDMVVMIGMDKYDSVSAVPDDEIRGVLQSAVNEWLARSSK